MAPVIGLMLICVAIIFVYSMVRGGSSAPAQADLFQGGLRPTYSHENIAVEAQSRTLWVRDENGKEAVLAPEDLVGWTVTHETTENRQGAGLPHSVYLDVRTRNPDKPLWRVRFNRHREKASDRRNASECQEWADGMNTLYKHGVEDAVA